MARSTKNNINPWLEELQKATPNKPINRRKYTFVEERFKTINHLQPLLTSIKNTKGTAMFRQGMFGTEVIWGVYKYRFCTKEQMKSLKTLFLFSMVKKDAIAFLKASHIKKQKWIPTVHWNKNPSPDALKKGIIGTDINGAYWETAFRLGIISQSTYEHGIRIKNKMINNASLSSLGSDKRFLSIKKGKISDSFYIMKGDDDLKEVYKKIRYTCFNVMRKIAKELGDDFICYKTDCIYYVNTKSNIKTVISILETTKMDYKMLDKFDGTISEY